MRLSPAVPLAAGLLAGCGTAPGPAAPPLAEPPGHRSLQHAEVPVDMNALDTRLYCAATAMSDAGAWWSCSMSIGQVSGGVPSGTFLMADSLSNKSLRGTITAGTITRLSGGGGTATLSGTLTTGAPITFSLTDANDAIARDRLAFDTGGLSYLGEVRHGAVRILRALPLSHGATNHPDFRFDSRIGLFIPATDLDAEAAPPPEPLPVRVLEVVRPNPVIDFMEDQLGGYTSEPGSDENVPPS